MSDSASILEVHHVEKHFGGVTAVHDCSFSVKEGSITGLIGPNGAGKTTTFNLITGVLKPDKGKIYYQGRLINGMPPDRIARLGLARTFQIPRIFERMTVWENVMFAVQDHPGERVATSLWPRHWRAYELAMAERAHEILAFVGLDHLADEHAGALSGGQRKLLELARILMLEPRVILLDEPMAGVNPAMRKALVERIQALNRQGITFLIIEHDMETIMNISHVLIVMHYGRVLAEGRPEDVRRDARVLDAYLGGVVS